MTGATNVVIQADVSDISASLQTVIASLGDFQTIRPVRARILFKIPRFVDFNSSIQMLTLLQC